MPDEAPVDVVAFVLPQFHPIPENDAWWGRGFTEWVNVARAKPLYAGHQQPRIPADLGFYDLRVPETQQQQAALASANGITAFCYWHYWFSGRRLLERPVQQLLDSGQPEFPFCVAWANESWSRRWLGEEQDVLVSQDYGAADDAEHAEVLAGMFADRNYLKRAGRPVFLMYRPMDHDDPRRFLRELRAASQRHGVQLPYVIAIDAHDPEADYRALGFDDVLSFEPQLRALHEAFGDGPSGRRLMRNLRQGALHLRAKVYSEESARRLFREHKRTYQPDSLPCVFVGWDNTPRRGRDGIIIASRSLEPFRLACTQARDEAAAQPPGRRVVFINAWNEWAEGNYLEPDAHRGDGYLHVVREVFASSSRLP